MNTERWTCSYKCTEIRKLSFARRFDLNIFITFPNKWYLLIGYCKVDLLAFVFFAIKINDFNWFWQVIVLHIVVVTMQFIKKSKVLLKLVWNSGTVFAAKIESKKVSIARQTKSFNGTFLQQVELLFQEIHRIFFFFSEKYIVYLDMFNGWVDWTWTKNGY